MWADQTGTGDSLISSTSIEDNTCLRRADTDTTYLRQRNQQIDFVTQSSWCDDSTQDTLNGEAYCRGCVIS